MAFIPTAITGAVTVSGDTTNAELRRIQEKFLIKKIEAATNSLFDGERDSSQRMGYEIR